jgi:pteridine reductase
MNLKQAVMLVTGGAHRVGKAIALSLAQEGADVAFTYHASKDEAMKTVAEIEALGVRTLALFCDQSKPELIGPVVERVTGELGSLNGLVNSASTWQEKTLFEITPQDWDTTMNINARGPFFFIHWAAKWMLAHNGGSIVNIIDESAVKPSRLHIHHGASKTALWMLTRSCALTLAPSVRVNAVLPGAVLKPPDWEEDRWQSLEETIPLQRLGTAEDVARAVVYLMKEEFITGQSIVVDGGSTLKT